MRKLLLEKKEITEDKQITVLISDDEEQLFVKTESVENGMNLTLEKMFKNNAIGNRQMDDHITKMTKENALTEHFNLG
jgi:hypothetical protein